jgi:hypothetical protein
MKTQLKQQKNNNDSIPRFPYIFKEMYFVTIVSRELIRTSAGTTTSMCESAHCTGRRLFETTKESKQKAEQEDNGGRGPCCWSSSVFFFVLSGLSCFVSVAAAAVKLGQSRRPFSSPP